MIALLLRNNNGQGLFQFILFISKFFFKNIIVHILLGNNRSAYKWKWIISDITINIYWIQRRGLNAKYKNICGFSS